MTIFNFNVYNGEKVYDVDSQTLVGSWVGDNTCTAKVVYSAMNWDTYQMEEFTVNLVLGQLNPIDLSGSDITITIVANEGFKFSEFVNDNGLGTLTEDTETVKKISMAWSEFSGYYDKTHEFKVALIADSVNPPDPEPETVKLDNTYLLTQAQYDAFKTELYSIVEGESISNEFQNPAKFPTSTYVIATKLMPFSIPETEKVELTSIKVKQSTMTAQGVKLKDNILKVNLGNIQIPFDYSGGALDYMGVSIELFLPFYSGSIELNPDHVMGRTVNIEYEVIINNGDTSVNIYNEDGLISTVKTPVGGDFPLFDAVNQDALIFAPTQALNNVMQAFVLVTKPVYTETPKTQYTDDLTQLHGNVVVIEHNIQIQGYADEKLMLEQALTQGVKFP